MRFGAAILVSVMSLSISVQATQDAQALPAAGQCSKSTGEWICNVENQNLNFNKTATITQTTAAGAPTIGDSISAPTALTYVDVYINGTTRINANVTITNVNGMPELDAGSFTPDFGAEIIGVRLDSTEDISFTIDFINAATSEPVTMLNIDLLVKDLDPGEHAQFQGISSYTLATTNTLSVTPSTAPNPESGQRLFTGQRDNPFATFNNPDAAVSVTFASASSLRLRAYFVNAGTNRGILFQFGPTVDFWTPATAAVSTSVGFGNYTVTYDANGGAGTLPTAVTASGTQTLSNGSDLVKSSIAISSWNTRADGTGQTLALGASFLPSGNTTLYAQYVAKTVTFDSNQGTGTMPNQINAGPVSLSANTFSRGGYSFAGWNTSSDGSGASFANSSSYPFSISETLYAQWTAKSNVVSYDEAGGSSVADGSFLTGGSVTLPSAPSRDGYTFSGWFRAASGGSALTSPYSPPDTSAITLFAQWTALPAQVVTWSPTNTSLMASQSRATPSSQASTSGNGAITYSVTREGTTGCSVNSATGVISFSSVGLCTVRASAASTNTFLGAFKDVVFEVGSTAPAMSLNLDLEIGETVANADIAYGASGLKPGSAWSLVVRSDPQTVASGTFASTAIGGTAQISTGLTPGWHSITFTGVSPTGSTVVQSVWFEVTSSGTLAQTSISEPEVKSAGTPSESLPSLANTGSNQSNLAIIAFLLIIIGCAIKLASLRVQRSEPYQR
jgi:uncharacterized repeat protein (TIGR02543 family)